MAFATFKLSRRARTVLWLTGILLSVLQIIFGTIIAVISIVGIVTISSKMHYLDEILLNKVFLSLAAFGLAVKVHNIYGLKLYMDCRSLSVHYKTRPKWISWLLMTWFLSTFTLIIACISKSCSENLILQLGNSMHQGMTQYLNDQNWKITWNKLQQDLKCCGVDTYKDWYSSSWIHSEQLLNDEQTVLKFTESDGRTLPPAIPWSCCNPYSRKPCVHDNLQQKHFIVAWKNDDTVALSTVFTIGCIKNIELSFKTGAKVVCGVCIFSFLIQVASTFIFQYLYTSVLNSIFLGDSNGNSYGWIFGRGDFGWSKGPTLGEINLAWQQRLVSQEGPKKSEEEKLLTDTAHIPSRRRKFKRKKNKDKKYEKTSTEIFNENRKHLNDLN